MGGCVSQLWKRKLIIFPTTLLVSRRVSGWIAEWEVHQSRIFAPYIFGVIDQRHYTLARYSWSMFNIFQHNHIQGFKLKLKRIQYEVRVFCDNPGCPCLAFPTLAWRCALWPEKNNNTNQELQPCVMCKWIVLISYSYDKLGVTFNATQLSGKTCIVCKWDEKNLQKTWPNSKERFGSTTELLGQGIERCNFLLISGTSKTARWPSSRGGGMGWKWSLFWK